MPQYPFPYYRNPFVAADTVQPQMIDTVPAECVVPSFITQGYGHAVIPVPRMTYDIFEGWNMALLGLIVLLIVLNKQLYPRQFRQVLSLPGGTAHTNQLLREWSPTGSFIGFSFMLSYVMMVALLVQKSFVVFSRDILSFNGLDKYFLFFAAVAGWVVMRHVVLHFMNWLFGTKDTVDRQLAVQLSVSTYGIIVLLPVVLLLLYNPTTLFVWIGLGICAIAALMRFVMEIVETRFFTKLPSFYIFSYFCALEIAPVATLLAAGLRYISKGSVF